MIDSNDKTDSGNERTGVPPGGLPKEPVAPIDDKKLIPADKPTMELPIMTIRNLVAYPGTILPLIISQKAAIQLIDDALTNNKTFAFVAIKPAANEETVTPAILEKEPPFVAEEGEEGEAESGPKGPGSSEPAPRDHPDAADEETAVEVDIKPADLYEYGCRVEIVKMMKYPDGTVKLLVQGVEKIKLDGIIQRQPYIKARVIILKEKVEQTSEVDALSRSVAGTFTNIVNQIPYLPYDELKLAVLNITSPLMMCYFIASNMNFPIAEKQKLLELDSVKDKLERLMRLLNHEAEVIKLGTKINTEIKDEITKAQKEQILREQMRIIQRELGEQDGNKSEINKLTEDLAKAKLPAEAKKVAEEELGRLSRMHPSSAEYTVSRTYLDWLINLPWAVATPDNLDIHRARKILNEDHYGLEQVKERILEYLAVRKLKPDMKGPILCFVGPPGVGKTSLGKSIARALGRNFIRFSLGGIRDEAEIRGHRRTYIGALPGRIIQWIRKAGSHNPVFMLDEIDKIGADFRGDPASALLETLDPEQNNSFSDHYLEVEFDLSPVMFITTANILDTIPGPLRDQMEVLELPGYIAAEKVKIAEYHLVPKQLAEHGLTKSDLNFNEPLLQKIVSDYTRESGVRNLEREIATVCRKIATIKASQPAHSKSPKPLPKPTPENLDKYLGPVKFYSEIAGRRPEQGVATGMVWTPVGGDIVFIEATRMKGNNGLILTGSLGDVMKESARAALSYIKSHMKEFNIPEEGFNNYDVHIHVPAGAIPKDGPSAGVAIAMALISLFIGRPIRNNVSMTGEITLRGRVLPVGGIREKVIGARRAGISTIVLPRENERDLKTIPKYILKGIKFKLIDRIEDAMKIALVPSKEKRQKRPTPKAKSATPKTAVPSAKKGNAERPTQNARRR